MGGASWPRLGADGGWVAPLKAMGLDSRPLRPANSGLDIVWSPQLIDKCEGKPLKNIRLSLGETTARGECVVTRRGLEGGVVYALSATLRDQVQSEGRAEIVIDLRPDLSEGQLAAKFERPRGKQSRANFLRKAAHLDPVAIALLREAGPPPSEPPALAAQIKALRLTVQGVSGLERAISTAGGVIWDAVDENLMSKSTPGVFLAGEMLDWEAPTGGYLLTACFATGRAAGAAAANWLKASG